MMLKLNNILKIATLSAVAFFCTALSAQSSIKVAVQVPRGDAALKGELSLVKDQLSEAIVNRVGFELFDRVDTGQIMEEHEFVRDTGLFSSNEARGLGEFEGADYVITSELSKLSDGAFNLAVKVLDIKTARTVGSSSKVVPSTAASALFANTCRDLADGLLKQVEVSLSAKAKGNVRDGLEGDIQKLLMNNKTNPKWNKNKGNYSVEVDISSMVITENKQFKTSRVTGSIYFTLTDHQSGDSSTTELELQEFTEMTVDLIKKKIVEQVKSKQNNIIRDLLSELD